MSINKQTINNYTLVGYHAGTMTANNIYVGWHSGLATYSPKLKEETRDWLVAIDFDYENFLKIFREVSKHNGSNDCITTTNAKLSDAVGKLFPDKNSWLVTDVILEQLMALGIIVRNSNEGVIYPIYVKIAEGY